MHDTDVIVVGAGMAGLLTALALARRGVHVTVVEPARLGAGQSGQSHGYLHRGYAYGPDEPRLPELLGRARRHWRTLLAHVPPVTEDSTIAFSQAAAVHRAERYWRRSGLPVHPQATPAWLTPEHAACFRSAEPTYNVGEVLRGLGVQASAAGVQLVEGGVERLRPQGDGVRVLLEGPGAAPAVLDARAVVVASGAGTPALLTRSGLPAPVVLRRALMLVLRGHLPAVSALFPGQEEHGLFLASRVGADGRTTWLVSDFQSFDGGGQDPGQLAGWWARRVLLTLRRLVDASVLAQVEAVSGYAAVKSGLAPVSGTVAHELGTPLLGGRVVVACPSKLTLTPLAARYAVETLGARLGLAPGGDGGDGWDAVVPVAPDASPAREAWETPLAGMTHPDLLGELPGIGTLSELYRGVPA